MNSTLRFPTSEIELSVRDVDGTLLWYLTCCRIPCRPTLAPGADTIAAEEPGMVTAIPQPRNCRCSTSRRIVVVKSAFTAVPEQIARSRECLPRARLQRARKTPSLSPFRRVSHRVLIVCR